LIPLPTYVLKEGIHTLPGARMVMCGHPLTSRRRGAPVKGDTCVFGSAGIVRGCFVNIPSVIFKRVSGVFQNEVFASSHCIMKRLLLVVIIRLERRVVNAQIFPFSDIPDCLRATMRRLSARFRLTRMRPRLTIPNSGYYFINRPMSAGL